MHSVDEEASPSTADEEHAASEEGDAVLEGSGEQGSQRDQPLRDQDLQEESVTSGVVAGVSGAVSPAEGTPAADEHAVRPSASEVRSVVAADRAADPAPESTEEQQTLEGEAKHTGITKEEPASVPQQPASGAPVPTTDAEMAANPASAADAADNAALEEKPLPKKKRQRRKPKPDKKHGVFSRFIAGAGRRRHAFSAGEVIAGRVAEAFEDYAVVDLFGKTSAIFHWPRAIQGSEGVSDAASQEGSAEEATGAASQPASGESPPAVSVEASPAPEGGSHAEALVEVDTQTNGSAAIAPAAAISAGAAGEQQPTDAPSESADQADAPSESANQADAPSRGSVPSVSTIVRGAVRHVSESGHLLVLEAAQDKAHAVKELAEVRTKRLQVGGVVCGFNRRGYDVSVGGAVAFCAARNLTASRTEKPHELVGKHFNFLVSTPQQTQEEDPAFNASYDLTVTRKSILEREMLDAAQACLASLSVGDEREGVVTQVRDFGLMVDLGGIEGLVHQTELSYDRQAKAADVAKVGDMRRVKVLQISPAEGKKEKLHRVSLSIKALQPDPWATHQEELQRGRIFRGKVLRTAEFGAFVEVAPHVDGLIHISEFDGKPKHADEAVKVGDELLVLIDRVDERSKRISLSKLSAAEAEAYDKGELDPKSLEKQPTRPGAVIKVVIEKVEPKGLSVRVPGAAGKRARGFLSTRDMTQASSEQGGKRKRLSAGDELEVKVTGVSKGGGLRLSQKALFEDEERKAVQHYRREVAKQSFGTFGDLLKAKLGDEDGEGKASS